MTTTKKAPATTAGAKAKKTSLPACLAHPCVIRITSGAEAGEYMSLDGTTGPRAEAHLWPDIAAALDYLDHERKADEHFEIVAEDFDDEGTGGVVFMTSVDVDAYFDPDTFATMVRTARPGTDAVGHYFTEDGSLTNDASKAKYFPTRLEAAEWASKQKKYAPQFYSQFEPRWMERADMVGEDASAGGDVSAALTADDATIAAGLQTGELVASGTVYEFGTDVDGMRAVVQGELLPPDAGAAPAVAADVTGLEIDGAGEARLVAVALRAHAEDLAKLAKNAKALGRLAEATTMERDARLITEELLAQLEPQTQLPFGYVDVRAALTARIHGKLRARLANQIRQDTPVVAGEQTQDREEKILAKIDDFEAILGNVAEIVVALVEPVVVEAAERGVTAGRLARETTAPALALEAAEAVERAA